MEDFAFCPKYGQKVACDADEVHTQNEVPVCCTQCGTLNHIADSYCIKCGACLKVENGAQMDSAQMDIANRLLVIKFSERLMMNAIVWIVISIIQIILGLCVHWVFLIVGVLNLVSAIKDIRYSRSVLRNPKGIVAQVEPLVGPILTLIYNLIFGGVIGVVGPIYYPFRSDL